MKRLLPLLLCLCLCLAACGAQTPSLPAAEKPLPSASPVPAEPWPAVPIYRDGLLTLRGYDCEGELYVFDKVQDKDGITNKRHIIRKTQVEF